MTGSKTLLMIQFIIKNTNDITEQNKYLLSNTNYVSKVLKIADMLLLYHSTKNTPISCNSDSKK